MPSNYLRTIVLAWGVAPEKVRTIYSVFEPPQLSGNREVLRGLLQFSGELVITVGRLVPWKGFPALISLMPKLKSAFPRVRLFIVGSGPEQGILEKLITKKRLAETVALGGSLPHNVLMRYLEAADVFVLNSHYEGFSHQLLEAMAVGVPVIATRAGGNEELITDGVNGILVNPDDEKAIEAAVRKILSDSALRARLTKAAGETVRSFTVERMLKDLVPLI